MPTSFVRFLSTGKSQNIMIKSVASLLMQNMAGIVFSIYIRAFFFWFI